MLFHARHKRYDEQIRSLCLGLCAASSVTKTNDSVECNIHPNFLLL